MNEAVSWGQVLMVIAANLAAFMWARKESSDDRRQFLNLLQAIQEEMKDFHSRLCIIESSKPPRRRKVK